MMVSASRLQFRPPPVLLATAALPPRRRKSRNQASGRPRRRRTSRLTRNCYRVGKSRRRCASICEGRASSVCACVPRVGVRLGFCLCRGIWLSRPSFVTSTLSSRHRATWQEKQGVVISRDQRNKRKFVTIIAGLDTFGVAPLPFSRVLFNCSHRSPSLLQSHFHACLLQRQHQG